MAVVYSGGQSSVDGDDDDPGVRVIASDVTNCLLYIILLEIFNCVIE
jgi:hypothetical protein